jgi:hypothetical protein
VFRFPIIVFLKGDFIENSQNYKASLIAEALEMEARCYNTTRPFILTYQFTFTSVFPSLSEKIVL